MSNKHITLFILLLYIFTYSCKNASISTRTTVSDTASIVKTIKNANYTKVSNESFLAWRATHLGGLDPRDGKVYIKEANISIDNGKIHNASILIDMNKLTVDNLPDDSAKELSDHLKSDDFFNTKIYPVSKFELTELVNLNGPFNSKIIGKLTILGISNSIEFDANFKISDKEVSIISENFIIDRSKWEMTYNAKGTVGIPLDYLISDEIEFNFNISIKNQELINQVKNLIDSLFKVDQNIQLEHSIAIKNGKDSSVKVLVNQQKNIFNSHIPYLKSIVNEIGYPTIELVGKNHSKKFFTLVQHADADIDFQDKMLCEILKEMKNGNVSNQNYAFLTDRVALSKRQSQVYGTQLNYDTNTGQAYPKKLKDSINVNIRRQEIGLEEIEEYLNEATKVHFKMNMERYLKMGITSPKLYSQK